MKNTIVFNPLLSPKWNDFGILIPLLMDRSLKVFSSLIELGHDLKEIDLDILPKFNQEDLNIAHDRQFIKNLFSEKLYNEFIDCFELINEDGSYNRYDPKNAKKELSEFMDHILLHLSGTSYSMEQALENNFCFFLGGGMHHARYDKGAGFCILNDIIFGIRRLQEAGRIKTCWVVDVDAHKGDGTAQMSFNNSSILTLSLHMEKGWPMDIEDPNHPSKTPSTIDIEINSNNEKEYNKLLKDGLLKLSLIQGESPDLIIVNDGADPYELDELPSTSFLNLSKETLLERDQIIYKFAKERNIPQCWLMSGGYGKSSYEIYVQFIDWVLSH